MNLIRRLASASLRAPGSLLIFSGLLVGALALFTSSQAHAQQLTGTLSATVYDTTGAAVPGASVVIKNEQSGDVRKTVSDGAGYFSFSAVQPATYTITISAKGFTTWRLTGLVMHLGDTRTVPNIALKAGAASTTVEVVADKNVTVPLDTTEVSTTMNAQQIEDVPLQGRNASELLKMMPGAAFSNGGSQGSSYNPKVTGTNSGPAGSYSLNGTQPNGAMALMLDGANLIDPGNAGSQLANINTDMVSEVKVLTSSYGAEYAYGPTIFEAFSKSGGKSFHGEGYMYARNSQLNSWDSFTKASYRAAIKNAAPGFAQSLAAKDFPYEYFYYIGGNVGGPVIIPGIKFNKNHDKLFFWGGYEYMIQHPNQNIINYNVLTANQRSGIFLKSPEAGNKNSAYQEAYLLPNGDLPSNVTTDASGNVHIPTEDYDANILGVLKLYPTPNVIPNSGNGWSNYSYAPSVPQNRWEATGKLDYAISDNTKLSGTYAYQSEVDQHPINIWWAPGQTLPYPALPTAATTSQMILLNFTHQFNATTTNEAVFNFARYVNPVKLSGNAADRSTVGMGAVHGLFGHTSTQMPNIWDNWSSGLSTFNIQSFDGAFGGGGFGKSARVPQFYDTVSKVVHTHTLKAGFYYAQPFNSQTNSGLPTGTDQGTFTLGWPSNYGTGNIVSDLELGRVSNYNQQNEIPIDNLKMNMWSIWGQDSWKANKQLTIDVGLRADHVGQWYGEPLGQQVWVGNYVDSPNAPANTGLSWNGKDKSIPLSGFSSPLFYYNPRVGMIYDLFGTGKTVLRAGYGVYHYQISVNEATSNGIADGPRGLINFSTPKAFMGYTNISAGGLPPASVSQSCWLCGNSVGADLLGDNRTPLTEDWNVSFDQALPWQSLLEVSYVANKTTSIEYGGQALNNLNNVPLGAYWQKDPILNEYVSPSAPCAQTPCNTNGINYPTFVANDYLPMHNYGGVYISKHNGYSNYNSLQVSWKKNGSKLNFQANYTFGKVLGTWTNDSSNGASMGNTIWPYALRANYGPLGYDHTSIFNIWYIYNLPHPIHGNRILGAVLNDWKLSGYNTYQSGAYLGTSTNANGNFQAILPSNTSAFGSGTPVTTPLFTMPSGLAANGQSTSTWMGTGSVPYLMPLLTCNPAAHLKSGQRFNPACFKDPDVIGKMGPYQWPYMRYPGYLDNDLSIFKSFPTREGQRLELRIQGQNWINHPNAQFGLAGPSDFQMQFNTIGGSNVNAATTGKPLNTIGQRQMTFSAKYYF